MVKVLVTGGSGLLGRAVCSELRGCGYDVVGTAYLRVADELVRLDVTERGELAGCVRKVRPGVIVHCAATRKPDVCEGDAEQTQALNVDATRWVAESAAEAGAWMIHISTDYVFDGTQPPYGPGAEANPLNAYGRSKWESEKVLPEVGGGWCVLRVPILYGEVESLDESPVTVIAMQLMGGEVRRFDNWAMRYPTHTADVAYVLRQMIEHKAKEPEFGGICHWSGDEAFTKFGMARVMCDILEIDKESISGVDEPAGGATRPKNSHLDCSLLEALGIGRQREFSRGVAGILDCRF